MSLNTETLQAEYANKAAMTDINGVAILTDLKNRPLSSQMRDIADISYTSDSEFLEEYMGYYNEKEDIIFILSNSDILDQLMYSAIKKELNDETSLSIVKINDTSEINYALRDNPVEVEFEDRLLKCYLQPKAHTQDAQAVYFTVEPAKPKATNTPKRRRP